MALVLASASPRRQALLNQVGCSYKIVPSDYTENNYLDVDPVQLAVQHAVGKALAVAKENIDDIIIGADTIVVLQGEIFGKPNDRDDARRMLTALSGKRHQVITGVAVVQANKVFSDFAVTEVQIRELPIEEIERYVASGEPLDKAGAYGIQEKGALLVERIDGCYFNVVGLPLTILNRLLGKVGVYLL